MTSFLRVIFSLAVVSFCLLEALGSANDSELIAEPRYHYKNHKRPRHRMADLAPSTDNTGSPAEAESTQHVAATPDTATTKKAREAFQDIEKKVANIVKGAHAKTLEFSKCASKKIGVVERALQRAHHDRKTCRLAFKKSTSPSTRTQDLDACLKKVLAEVETPANALTTDLMACYPKTV